MFKEIRAAWQVIISRVRFPAVLKRWGKNVVREMFNGKIAFPVGRICNLFVIDGQNGAAWTDSAAVVNVNGYVLVDWRATFRSLSYLIGKVEQPRWLALES